MRPLTKHSILDDKPIDVNKQTPPPSINKDSTPSNFTAIVIDAKISGKSCCLVTLLKFYENVFCKTANSAVNPIMIPIF
jgi:hypothetical protein